MGSTRYLVYFACFALAQTAHSAPACGGHGDRNSLLVSTAWLAGHLTDPNLVVLAVGKKSEYDSAHIPGSHFVEYMDTHLMEGPSGLSLELPPMADLVQVFTKVGVSNSSRIILYMTNDWVSPTARIFVTLDAMGLGAHIPILDGGFPVWKREGRPASTEVSIAKRGHIEPCPQRDVIADLNYMRSNLHHAGVDILDARQPDYYTGAKTPEGQRQGHIPGASSLAFEKLVDENGKFKSPDALKAELAHAGVKPGDVVVSYCHVGQRASVDYFVARYLGYDARMYDGSWDEWSKHTELAAEVTPQKRP